MRKNKQENLKQELETLRNKQNILKIQYSNQKEKERRLSESIKDTKVKFDKVSYRIKQIQDQLFQNEEIVEQETQSLKTQKSSSTSTDQVNLRISEDPNVYQS